MFSKKNLIDLAFYAFILVAVILAVSFISATYKAEAYKDAYESSVQKNKEIADVVQKIEHSNKSTEEVAQSINSTTSEIKENASAIKEQMNAKMLELEKKYPEASITDVQRDIKRLEMREIKVNSLWLLYCEKNKQDPQCIEK